MGDNKGEGRCIFLVQRYKQKLDSKSGEVADITSQMKESAQSSMARKIIPDGLIALPRVRLVNSVPVCSNWMNI